MGLTACPRSALTEFDDTYPEQMRQRRNLLDTQHETVFAALPHTEAAQAETLDLLIDHLTTDHPTWFDRTSSAHTGPLIKNRLTGERWTLDPPPPNPLERAGRLVAEDLCLLNQPHDGAPFHLVAAILCFPSRWRLADKLGQPLTAIHAPVPTYATHLASPVDRFMMSLKPNRSVTRLNWSIHDNPALHQPHGHATPPQPITAENAGTTLHLRLERQTLTRLPRTGAILFTIRTHQHKLATITQTTAWAETIKALPPDLATYKGISHFRDVLLAYLDGKGAR